jgi:hypothetical protein
MTVSVFHSSSLGHEIELTLWSVGRGVQQPVNIGHWKGLGCPEKVLQEARTMVDAAFSSHVINRYGIADELPLKWSGGPEPF